MNLYVFSWRTNHGFYIRGIYAKSEEIAKTLKVGTPNFSLNYLCPKELQSYHGLTLEHIEENTDKEEGLAFEIDNYF